jgi:hypothetical protein
MPVVVRLTLRQRLKRAYGIWWDIINTGTALALLTLLFLALSFALMSGQASSFFGVIGLLDGFAANVSSARQSEIGLSALGVTISASSAAALYLVRIGTSRWAVNRRMGFILAYFAEALIWRAARPNLDKANVDATLSSFVDVSIDISEMINETHPACQILFERARVKAHSAIRDNDSGNIDIAEVSAIIYAAAAICRKSVVLPEDEPSLKIRVERYLLEYI